MIYLKSQIALWPKVRKTNELEILTCFLKHCLFTFLAEWEHCCNIHLKQQLTNHILFIHSKKSKIFRSKNFLFPIYLNSFLYSIRSTPPFEVTYGNKLGLYSTISLHFLLIRIGRKSVIIIIIIFLCSAFFLWAFLCLFFLLTYLGNRYFIPSRVPASIANRSQGW